MIYSKRHNGWTSRRSIIRDNTGRPVRARRTRTRSPR